jgi:enoyl-CoA hydratase/carnithine racemase
MKGEAFMRFTDIVYRKADGIAWLTINRPEVYNAIRGKTSDEMGEALQEAAADAAVRVVVINGAGPNAFSSGRD